MNDNCLGFLGILYVARKALIGEEAYSSLPKAKLVLLAKDAKDGTKKMIQNAKNHHHFPLLEVYTKETLGSALGYEEVAYISIIDKRSAEKLISALISKQGGTI